MRVLDVLRKCAFIKLMSLLAMVAGPVSAQTWCARDGFYWQEPAQGCGVGDKRMTAATLVLCRPPGAIERTEMTLATCIREVGRFHGVVQGQPQEPPKATTSVVPPAPDSLVMSIQLLLTGLSFDP